MTELHNTALIEWWGKELLVSYTLSPGRADPQDGDASPPTLEIERIWEDGADITNNIKQDDEDYMEIHDLVFQCDSVWETINY